MGKRLAPEKQTAILDAIDRGYSARQAALEAGVSHGTAATLALQHRATQAALTAQPEWQAEQAAAVQSLVRRNIEVQTGLLELMHDQDWVREHTSALAAVAYAYRTVASVGANYLLASLGGTIDGLRAESSENAP